MEDIATKYDMIKHMEEDLNVGEVNMEKDNPKCLQCNRNFGNNKDL